jgi:effector-binding domain-containing protein
MVLVLSFTQLPALAQTQPPGKPEYTVSPMRIATLKDTAYMYESQQATLATVGPIVDKQMNEMTSAMKDGAFSPTGPPIIVYHGATTDPDKQFTVDLGFPVADTATAGGDFQLGKVKGVMSATAVFTGPMTQIRQAYVRLFGQLIAAGHTPTEERRERYLYWEGADSTNNVVLIEIELQN